MPRKISMQSLQSLGKVSIQSFRKLSTHSIYVAFWNFKTTRLYVTLIFSIAFLSNCMINNTLSMAMVCMVNGTALSHLNNSSSNKPDNYSKPCGTEAENSTKYEGPFVWTHKEQALMFSSLFIGGLLSILPSGWLSDRYNPKAIGTLGLLISTLACLLTPIVAEYGDFVGMFLMRFVVGFFGIAIIMSGISSISARWIPPTERSTVLAIYTSGNQLANIIGMPMNAALCSSNFMGTWQSIFYINALFGIVATALWFIFLTNVPDENPFTTDKEKLYIKRMLVNENLGEREEIMKKIPWKKMLFAPVMLTLFINNFTNSLLLALMMTYLPTYFKEALGLNLKSNGLYSALPYICQLFATFMFAFLSDHIKKKKRYSDTLIAKCFNTVGTFGSSIFLVACAYMDCTSTILALVFLSLANTLLSGCVPGWATCLLCVAPAYSGVIGAIGRFTGQIGAALSPYLVSLIVLEGTADEWRIVFIIVAALVFLSGLLFIFLGSAELQEWAKEQRVEQISIAEESITLANDSLLKNKSQLSFRNCEIIIEDDNELVGFISHESIEKTIMSDTREMLPLKVENSETETSYE